MKLFVHYEPSDAGKALGATEVHTMKAGLPKSWYAGPVSKVKQLFIEAYEKKHGASLDASKWQLVKADGKAVPDEAAIQDVLEAGMDLRLRPKPGAAPSSLGGSAVAVPALEPGQVQCRGYGCRKGFKPEDNDGSACRHHTAPPCFNDVRKWWACCPNSVAYDWEEFMTIEGCATGRHSEVEPGKTFAPSPRAEAAAAEGAGAAVPVSVAGGAAASATPQFQSQAKSIDAYNAAHPDATTAASSVAKTVSTRPKAIRREADGRYRCMNKGCGQGDAEAVWFRLEDNSEEACRHHDGAPVFHDGGKRWSCCSESTGKCWTFEEFMALPGCRTGRHDPGEL